LNSKEVKMEVYQLPHAYFLLVLKQGYQLIERWGEIYLEVSSSSGKR